MSKQELQAKLDGMNVKYDKRWGESRLQALISEQTPEITTEQIKQHVENLTDDKSVPTEELYKETKVNSDGDRETKSGIIIPRKALAQMSKTRWHYTTDERTDAVDVKKVYNKNVQFVRTYTKERHGEDYRKLAKMFADKNNR